jgi:hypothetical protein
MARPENRKNDTLKYFLWYFKKTKKNNSNKICPMVFSENR